MSVKIEKRVLAVEVEVSADAVVLDDTNAEELIARLNVLKAAVKEVEAESKAVRDEIMALMGEAKVGIIRGADRVFLQEIVREEIDRDMLREEFAEVWDAVARQKAHIRLVTK